MDVSIFAFEQQVSLIRQELFKKGGLLSKPTPPSAEELQTGLDSALGRIDDFVFPRLSASRVVRYFYGARLRDGGSKLSSVSTSFALAALTTPELVTSPRVFAFPDREDRFVSSQVRQMLRELGDQADFEIGLLYLSDLAKPEIEQIFKDAYVEFSERAKGELHLLTLAENGILNLSLGNLPNGTLGGSLAGEVSGRIAHDTLNAVTVEAFLTMMDIGRADDGIKGAVRSALLSEEVDPADVRAAKVERADVNTNTDQHSYFSVRLVESGEKKINVISAIRRVANVSVKDAKDKAEGAPVILLTELAEAQAVQAKLQLEEAGATVEIIKDGIVHSSNNGFSDDIPQKEEIVDFLDAVTDKILERGLLTKIIGFQDFDIKMSMEFYDNNGSQNLKVNLNILADSDLKPLSSDRCDEIQDLVIDYLKEKGINDLLIEAGIRSDDPMYDPADMIDWVQIAINGKKLY